MKRTENRQIKDEGGEDHSGRRGSNAKPQPSTAPEHRQTEDQRKSTEDYQLELWSRWRAPEEWPYRQDLYEAAAYLRVSPATIRRAIAVDRTGCARLPHQRVLTAYRFRRPDLDAFGLVLAQEQTQCGPTPAS